MSQWIRLDDEKYNKTRKEVVRGVEFNVFMSPYDVPRAINGDFNKKTNRFRIDFEYIVADEPQERRAVAPTIWVLIGKNSGRLYAIDVDVKAMNVNAVALQVYNAIVGLQQEPSRKPTTRARRDNYRAAAEAVNDSKERLFAFA